LSVAGRAATALVDDEVWRLLRLSIALAIFVVIRVRSSPSAASPPPTSAAAVGVFLDVVDGRGVERVLGGSWRENGSVWNGDVGDFARWTAAVSAATAVCTVVSNLLRERRGQKPGDSGRADRHGPAAAAEVCA
jgi:hypothetical protein